MATTKPDHAAQRAAQAAKAAALAQQHAQATAQRNAARQQAQQAVAAQKQARLTAQQNAAANKAAAKLAQTQAKQAAALAAAQNKAAIAAARYAANHPQSVLSNPTGPSSIVQVGTGDGSPGSASTVPDYALPPGVTTGGPSISSDSLDSSNTLQPDVNGGSSKSASSQTFFQKHKTAVIVVASIGGVVLLVGLYGYAKYRAFTYPFRKASKILGIAQGAGRAVGSVLKS